MQKIILTLLCSLLFISFSASSKATTDDYSFLMNSINEFVNASQPTYASSVQITDPKILNALDAIKELPNGEKYIKILQGNNYTKKPILIEFIDFSKLPNVNGINIETSPCAIGNNGNIYIIYLNKSISSLPKEALATFIVSSLMEADSNNTQISLNKETYLQTILAATWTYYTFKNTELENSMPTPYREYFNLYKDLYKRGNYSDTYIKILTKAIFKNIPEKSPGYETIPTIDNSMFSPIKEAVIANEINNSQANNENSIILKGTFSLDNKPVDNNKFISKTKYDNTIYSNEKKNLSQEQYHLYRILERIVRANNIDFTSWRLIIVDDYNFNASSTDNNLVIINRGLYNKLRYNDDALALVISHELSHLILNHLPEMHKYVQQIEYLENRSVVRENNAYSGARNAVNSYGDDTSDIIAMIGWGAYSTINGIQASADQLAIDKIWKKIQSQEFEADNEGFVLTHRAGYNLARATLTFDIMSTMPNVYTRRSTHPPVRARYVNLKNNIPNMTTQQINDGKKNIYNSNVLKSHSDNTHKIFYIDKTANYNKMYKPENSISRQWRLAYNSYNSYRLDDAIFYLKDLSKLDHNNYIHPLYISYANEYLYRKTGSKKYLSESIKYAKKADKINQNNKYVQQQLYDLNNLR